VLAASSAIVFFGAVGAGIVQSFRTRGRPPSLSITPDELVRDLLDAGEYDAASIEYATALRLNPEGRDRGALLVLHGQSLAGLGRGEEAVARYREALAANFDRAEVRLMLAAALIGLERFDEAIPEFRLGLAGKDDAGARNNLGYALERIGDRAAALAEYRRAEALAPDLPSAQLNLGRALLLEGRPEESIAALVAATRLAPELALAHAQLGDAYWKLGRYNEAADAYRSARDLAPDHAPVRDGLIKSLLAAGRDREAVVELRAAADVGGGDAALLNELAWRLATAPDPSLRDPAEAVGFGLRAVEIAANPHSLDTLAAAYAAAGRYNEAVATAKRAVAAAEQRGDVTLASEIRDRLGLFEAGIAFIEGDTPEP
jgi:spermidine synthase